ncbi:hypothetical protein SB861_46615 [Paraburkholderia sp. SIMBA_049]
MTILYIHGVSVRSPDPGIALGKSFLRWLGPKVSRSGQSVDYVPVYWGDVAAKFLWHLESRPKTLLLKQGAEDALAIARTFGYTGRLPPAAPGVPKQGPVIGAPPAPVAEAAVSLAGVAPERRADLLADLYLAFAPEANAENTASDEKKFTALDSAKIASLPAACAAAADQWDAIISNNPPQQQTSALMRAVEKELSGGMIVQGGFADWMSRASEAVNRAGSLPFNAISSIAAELRPRVHEATAYFLGDVLTYMNTRQQPDGKPGAIPQRVLEPLARAHLRKQETGEPIVILTHSMGGQLLYDVLTHFIAQDQRFHGLSLDHWITCGSQVSFFAELGLFIGQPAVADGAKLNAPACVKAWTNYYDLNDVVGFIMKPVFEGVTDIGYDTGCGLGFAHSGFLTRPTFFESVAERLGDLR